MIGTIDFRHDTKDDIVFATPHWKIETPEDCEVWFNQWAEYLNKFNRKVDCIMILDDFIISGQIAEKWGEYRAKLNNTYTRFSYRINPKILAGIIIKTSGVQYNAASKEAKNLVSAIEAIKEERRKAGL